MATRGELVTLTAERYGRATRGERSVILDEFAAITGFHRRHPARLLRSGLHRPPTGCRPGRRVYDDPVREALIYRLTDQAHIITTDTDS